MEIRNEEKELNFFNFFSLKSKALETIKQQRK